MMQTRPSLKRNKTASSSPLAVDAEKQDRPTAFDVPSAGLQSLNMSPNPLRYSTEPQPAYSGYLTLLTKLRTHKRYISISNTALTYGHRPDNILWKVDLTQCEITTSAYHLCIRLPRGKTVRFRLSKPELQIWYPRIMRGSMGLGKFYCVGGRIGCVGGCPLFSGCSREYGEDVRVWSVDKHDISRNCCLASRDRTVLRICQRVERAIEVMDVFEDCDSFHVVTETFRGTDLKRGSGTGGLQRGALKDVLSVLAVLHGYGMAHGGLEDAVVVDGGRAWVMVYGYAHAGSEQEMVQDGRYVAGLLREAGGMGRAVEMLEMGVVVGKVLSDFGFLEHGDRDQAELVSPRSVLQSGNVVR